MRFALDSTARKNRIAASRTTGASRRADSAVRSAAVSIVESLEGRRLLASVAAGQIGVFQGPNDQPVKISITGSGGSLDFIGATRTATGAPQLNDIPMTIFDAAGNVVRENLGGYAGRRGIRLADEVLNNNVGNSEFTGPVAPYTNVPSGRVNLDGLASNNLGKTYGVNRYLAGPGDARVDILRVDSKAGNVQRDAEVSDQVLDQLQQINPAFTKGDILSVIGADFPPDNSNLMYFALNVNYPTVNGTSTTRTETPAMFTYNLVTKEVQIDPNLFGFNTSDDKIRIDDFSFMDDGRIVMFGSVQFGQAGNPQVGMFFSDADAVVPGEFQDVRIGEQLPGQPPPAPTTSLAAIEVVPGENYMIGVTLADPAGGADDAQLVQINLATGRGTVIGSVVNPDEPTDVTSRLGENIRDLAWNPRVVDQYFQPGKRGVMLGAESTRDQLVALDIRQRFPNTDLYAIYGNNVKPDLSAAISNFTLDPRTTLTFNQRLFQGLMDPFGSAGSVRTNMVAGPPVNIPLGNGGVYLGLRTPDITSAITVPVLGLSSRSELAGSKPGVALPKNVRPGIFINGSMKSLYLAGTVTGSVNINGSIDTLYAGNVITGDPLNGSDNGTDNFFVNGDIRNLIVSGGIGTLAGAPGLFSPGTDLQINGKVQQIKAADGFRGATDVVGRTSEQSVTSSLKEQEFIPATNLQNRVALAFAGDLDGSFEVVDPVVRNDTFDTAQILGSYYSRSRKRGGQAQVVGNLNNGPTHGDNADYYGVPLLAGQSIQVQLDDLLGTELPANGSLIDTTAIYLSVIDPNGQVVSTDRSNLNTASFLNQAFQVTADKPGVWRLAVRPVSSSLSIDVDRPYQLTIDKLGDMSLGGLVSQGAAFFDHADVGVRTRSGDLGAILATGAVQGTGSLSGGGRNPTLANAISAQTGNIRSIEGSTIAVLQNGLYTNFPNVTAPRGSVGLMRSTGFMYFNFSGLAPTTGEPVPSATVGGDYQVIDAGTDVSGIVSANGSIGVIRAGSWGQNIRNFPGYIQIDANGDGRGAELGLIDVTQDFGTQPFGGPVISNGNGNVRYLRVGGDVFRPARRGGGGLAVSTSVDRSQTITDDSGATVTISPYNGVDTSTGVQPGSSNNNNGVPDPFGGNGNPSNGNGGNGIPDPFGGATDVPIGINPFDPFNGANDPNTPVNVITPSPSDVIGTLTVATYPVAGGGSIIYDVQSTTGVAINVSKKGGGGSGDITTLTTDGSISPGVPIVNPTSDFDLGTVKPTQNLPLIEGTGTTLDMIMTGGTVNVFQIGTTFVPGTANVSTGGTIDPTNVLNFSRILNNTNGEIVNIRAGDVGYLGAQTLGVSRAVNGVKIEGVNTATDARFTGVGAGQFNQRNGIFIDNAIDVQSRGAIGNIVVADTVQNLEANSDRVNDKHVFEGIVAPIIMLNNDELLGGIRRIDIGEGLATSGSGEIALSGIFSSGAIGLITNDNGSGDLRGDVIAGRYLEGIRLGGGGSILNADIVQGTNISLGGTIVTGTAARLGLGQEDIVQAIPQANAQTDTRLLNGIGDIRLSGNGGMLNTFITTYNIGRITTDAAGFGVMNSDIESNSGAKMDGINAGGLGIRNTNYTGGSTIGDVVAAGNGKLVDVRNLSKSVRTSEFGYFDAAGIAPNASTDINLLLGTSKKLPKIEGVTNSGVLQDSNISASRSIKSVKAYEIRGVDSKGARPRDEAYPMQINFANSIGSITASHNINGARVVGGQIGTLAAGRDITQFELQSNAKVKAIKAGRNILGTANFNFTGNGSLDLLSVNGNLNGTANAPKGIRTIFVAGKLGSAKDQGGIHSGTDINLLQVNGYVASNAYVRANRTIKSIIIGGDLQDNATIRAANFGTQKIGGKIDGDIITG